MALVLDNSGSMSETGTGSGKKRIDLLKDASKQLVDTIAGQAALMKQVSKPVQFALVPFSASVNVGPRQRRRGTGWTRTASRRSITRTSTGRRFTDAEQEGRSMIGGVWYKKGTGWGEEEGQKVSRFSLFKDMKQISYTVGGDRPGVRLHASGERHLPDGHWQKTATTSRPRPYASWQGCVEARPYPYNMNDAAARQATPATLFVPMFAPDEPGDRWTSTTDLTTTAPRTTGGTTAPRTARHHAPEDT